MNNFIQHVTGQLVWLGEHRGLFLLLIVELFAGVCLLIGFFQLKIKKQNEAAGVFKGCLLYTSLSYENTIWSL